KMLLIYMTNDDSPNAHVHLWEATFSAFSDDIQLVSANQVDMTTFHTHDVIIFIGDEPGDVPVPLQNAFEQFKGRIIAFGHNVEQLQPYEEWEFTGEKTIRMLDEEPLQTTFSIVAVNPPSDSINLSVGRTLD